MLSVNNMLNNKSAYKKPSVLDINSLLNNDIEQQPKSPSLSPSLTSSPASVSSFTSYPFPEENDTGNEKKDYLKFYHRQYQHRNSTSSLISDDMELSSTAKNIKEQVHELIHQVNQENNEQDSDEDSDMMIDGPIKAKRRRANAKQLEVLNRVFDRTFFPSTQMRAELGRQLGMSPRTVQIWFQNRRQAMRTRERQRLIKLKSTTK